MENIRKTTFEMHTLLLGVDVQFLGTTRGVLKQLHVTPKIVAACDDALELIQTQEFDVVVVDWREIENLGDIVSAVRRSKLNADCVLVAIVRDLLDLRQAFAAGVHFLIHKPASVVQIDRCMRAAYCATVAWRRKQHREQVNIVASVSTRVHPFAEMTVVNLSEGGAGLWMDFDAELGAHLCVGDEVELRFTLAGTNDMLQISGKIVWTTSAAGSSSGIFRTRSGWRWSSGLRCAWSARWQKCVCA